MIKRLLCALSLSVVALQCSGCATILGGIIGYQSAELCAGLAIGAAVDFTDDIVRGVGQMTAKEQNFCRDFNENSTMNAHKGEITLPINPFNRQRIATVVAGLQDTFQKNGGTYELLEKKSKKPFIIGPHCSYEKWKCTTAEQESFEMEIQFNSDRDTTFRILDGSDEKRAKYTSRLYQWLQAAICTPAAA
jgi:hypothetical protein